MSIVTFKGNANTLIDYLHERGVSVTVFRDALHIWRNLSRSERNLFLHADQVCFYPHKSRISRLVQITKNKTASGTRVPKSGN